MKNPPFEITQTMLTDSAYISELVGRISAEKPSLNPILRRTNRIRSIQGTLAIEQNTLSIEQITAVLNGKRVTAPPRDIAEVRKAYAVIATGENAIYANIILQKSVIQPDDYSAQHITLTEGQYITSPQGDISQKTSGASGSAFMFFVFNA